MIRLGALLLLAACARVPSDAPDPQTERCTDDGREAKCLYQRAVLRSRDVDWQVPRGDAPAAGWPVVIWFHGSFMGTAPAWDSKVNGSFGGYRLAQTTMALLERGYAVLTPQSLHSGSWFWNSNVVGYADNWAAAPDAALMTELLEELGKGTFGPLDASRLYATGISSGGYMTSRMAVSYAGRFRALAVHSASYATCSTVCTVPELPADHPPTLLLHGEKDVIVPIATMRAYEATLTDGGFEVETEIDPNASHEWLETAVTRLPDWFSRH